MGKDRAIGIIGNGVVGRATHRIFGNLREVLIHDADESRSTHTLVEIAERCELIFLCLPTPPFSPPHGGLDCGVIDSICKDLHRKQIDPKSLNLVIRSTVPIGYTQKLADAWGMGFTHYPEFLTERTLEQDIHHPKNILVGVITSERIPSQSLLMDLLKKRYPNRSINISTAEESEAVKLFCNHFYASKVLLCNLYQQACERLGIYYQTVRKEMVLQGMINPQHTEVPGPDGQFGYGGKCLPKDHQQASLEICEAIDQSGDATIPARLFHTIQQLNKLLRGEAL